MSSFATERVERISKIMPAFSENAMPGDQIVLGLEGDSLFPNAYRSNRPHMTVVQSKRTESGYDIEAMDNSTKEVMTLSSNAIDPRTVWEFTDASFENVMLRAEQKYRRSSLEQETGGLYEKVNQLESLYRSSVSENAKFRNAVIEGMSEMAKEVSSMGNAPFCALLNKEYRGQYVSKNNTLTSKLEEGYSSESSNEDLF